SPKHVVRAELYAPSPVCLSFIKTTRPVHQNALVENRRMRIFLKAERGDLYRNVEMSLVEQRHARSFYGRFSATGSLKRI
ncbi:uncharacterized, partial [Tachysurus ichikawai]